MAGLTKEEMSFVDFILEELIQGKQISNDILVELISTMCDAHDDYRIENHDLKEKLKERDEYIEDWVH